ncbi:MAG TPA: hypothetical protein VFZ40_00890, partial [Pyrinomonadaceae bacterium]
MSIKLLSRIVRRSVIISTLTSLLTISLSTQVIGQKNERGIKLGSSEPVKSLPVKAKRYALIIGVDQYADT